MITEKTEPQSAETQAALAYIANIKNSVSKIVVGQDVVVERLLIALLTSGHLLLEGMPGLAKTLLVNAMAKAIHLDFSRVQFTIDLLPSDILGSEILNQSTGSFDTHKGTPVIGNIFDNFIFILSLVAEIKSPANDHYI